VKVIEVEKAGTTVCNVGAEPLQKVKLCINQRVFCELADLPSCGWIQLKKI
jgi:hypothetical protein